MSPPHFELPRGQEALLEDDALYYRHTHTLPLSLLLTCAAKYGIWPP